VDIILTLRNSNEKEINIKYESKLIRFGVSKIYCEPIMTNEYFLLYESAIKDEVFEKKIFSNSEIRILILNN
jgi:hypothetical protein